MINNTEINFEQKQNKKIYICNKHIIYFEIKAMSEISPNKSL